MATSSLQSIPSHLVDLAAGEQFGDSPERLELTPEAFKIRNYLAEHPLFENERIVQLLQRMPREFIEIRSVQSTSTNWCSGSIKERWSIGRNTSRQCSSRSTCRRARARFCRCLPRTA